MYVHVQQQKQKQQKQQKKKRDAGCLGCALPVFSHHMGGWRGRRAGKAAEQRSERRKNEARRTVSALSRERGRARESGRRVADFRRTDHPPPSSPKRRKRKEGLLKKPIKN